MKRDRFEEMGRTTFAGQLSIDGEEAAATVVRPQPEEKPVDRQKGSAQVPQPATLPFEGGA